MRPVQRPADVLDQIVRVLQPDRQPNRTGIDAQFRRASSVRFLCVVVAG